MFERIKKRRNERIKKRKATKEAAAKKLRASKLSGVSPFGNKSKIKPNKKSGFGGGAPKPKSTTFGQAFKASKLGDTFSYKGKKYARVTADQVKAAGYKTLREYLNAKSPKPIKAKDTRPRATRTKDNRPKATRTKKSPGLTLATKLGTKQKSRISKPSGPGLRFPKKRTVNRKQARSGR